MKKVFIIDDDQDVVHALAIVLQSAGYTVISQYDTVDAVRTVAAQHPDLVIVDVMFPEDDDAGYSVARALRESPKTEAIPLLVFSALSVRHLRAGGLTHHERDGGWLASTELLEKPVDPNLLLQKVRALIGTPTEGVAHMPRSLDRHPEL